jgi:hypothetical protein
MPLTDDLSKLARSANGIFNSITANATAITSMSVGATNSANLTTTTNVATIGTAAYFVANGNVGIGNSTPDAKLAITGTANISGNVVFGGIATVTGNVTLGSSAFFVGNGVSITTVNATSITTGTLPDARLSAAVVNTSGNFTVAGNINFTGTNNYFSNIVTIGTTTYFVANGNVGIGTSTPGAMLAVTGSATTLSSLLTNIAEPATISATAATGTINYDITTQSVLYYTSNASANWTVNFRGSSGTSSNTLMTTGQSITVAFLVTQGAVAYYNNAVQVDGTPVTPRYQGGSAWTAGNASSVDIYTYTIMKTGSAAFSVFASQTQFK